MRIHKHFRHMPMNTRGGGGGGDSPHNLVGMCHGKGKNGELWSELERENAGLRS